MSYPKSKFFNESDWLKACNNPNYSGKMEMMAESLERYHFIKDCLRWYFRLEESQALLKEYIEVTQIALPKSQLILSKTRGIEDNKAWNIITEITGYNNPDIQQVLAAAKAIVTLGDLITSGKFYTFNRSEGTEVCLEKKSQRTYTVTFTSIEASIASELCAKNAALMRISDYICRQEFEYDPNLLGKQFKELVDATLVLS
jgi:hypothetical protein